VQNFFNAISAKFRGNEDPGIGTTSIVRRGDWKLVYYYKNEII